MKSSQKQEIKSSSKSVLLLFFFLMFVISGLLFYYWLLEDAKYDESLLLPVVKIGNKSELIKKVNEQEIDQVIASFSNPFLIPKGIEVPEFSAEQDRPTREFLDTCVVDANVIIKIGTYSRELFNKENVVRWNNAYAKTNNPQYLGFILKAFTEIENLTLEEMIHFTDILKVQRLAVSVGDSNVYVNSINKIILTIDENKSTKDPLIALETLILANSLPNENIILETTNTLKPVLVNAFHHKNETRQDGLFLTPEQSTQFSLNLIKLAWHFYVNKKNMTEWLFKLSEKEACRLAYRLEPDGCLPVWDHDEQRISRSQEIYLASIVFDRDDLRYISSGGYRMENAYPPSQKDFNFKEIGISIIRTSWNNQHSKIVHHFGEKPFESEDSIQATYDQNSNKISLSVGTITQLVFETSSNFKNLNDFANAIEFSFNGKNESNQYKVIINQKELKNLMLSKYYLLEESGNIKSCDIEMPLSDFQVYKNSYDIKMVKIEKNNSIELNFLNK